MFVWMLSFTVSVHMTATTLAVCRSGPPKYVSLGFLQVGLSLAATWGPPPRKGAMPGRRPLARRGSCAGWRVAACWEARIGSAGALEGGDAVSGGDAPCSASELHPRSRKEPSAAPIRKRDFMT